MLTDKITNEIKKQRLVATTSEYCRIILQCSQFLEMGYISFKVL